MGVDAVAVLRIPNLASPQGPFGDLAVVGHVGDASLVNTMIRYGAPVDEIGLALRELFGHQLDAHDDPRGIKLFGDAYEPRAQDYHGLIAELSDGPWAPIVGIDHIPWRYLHAEPGSADALVLQLIHHEGRDAALTRAHMLRAQAIAAVYTPEIAHMVEGYGRGLAEVAERMGKDFADALDARLRAEAEPPFPPQPMIFPFGED